MRLGQPLRVHGPLTKDALCNLHEFQEAWVRWKPRIYRKVEVIPSEIVMPEIGVDRRAIAAFSGGVDSVFTIMRHNRNHLGNASYPLRHSVLMVHGFDIPLSSPDQLALLQERTKPLLDDLNLKLLTIRTNLKAANLQDWEDSFMAQLSCCLQTTHTISITPLSEAPNPMMAWFYLGARTRQQTICSPVLRCGSSMMARASLGRRRLVYRQRPNSIQRAESLLGREGNA